MSRARYSFSDLNGKSQSFVNAIRIAKTAALGDSTVLITGESGTGKELFAQAIHNGGARCDGPFIVLNCGAVPLDIVESLLFGYAPGSFTGGKKEGSQGAFQKAHGGTLFLDEIGEMPLSMQVKLLRVLQERQVCRIGESREIPIDIRIISATNRDLSQMVKDGEFREDLYWRLNVLELAVPPLRERAGDIVELALYFLRKTAPKFNKEARDISPQLAEAYMNYSWPGNVRELQNLMEREVNMISQDATILEHIAQRVLEGGQKRLGRIDEAEKGRGGPEGAAIAGNLIDPFSRLGHGDKGPDGLDGPLKPDDILPFQEQEKSIYARALLACCGNISEAARRLGVGRTTFYRKVQRLGLQDLAQADGMEKGI